MQLHYLIPLLVVVSFLCSCNIDNHTQNEHIVKETKYCLDSGFGARPLYGHDGRIMEIECVPTGYEDKNATVKK